MGIITTLINNAGEQINVSSSRQIIKLIEDDGWVFHHATGSHHHFTHPTKKGVVTVIHPKKDLKKGTENSILKQAGLK